MQRAAGGPPSRWPPITSWQVQRHLPPTQTPCPRSGRPWPPAPAAISHETDAQAAGLLTYRQINSRSDSAAYQETCLSPNPFSAWRVYCKITKVFSLWQVTGKCPVSLSVIRGWRAPPPRTRTRSHASPARPRTATTPSPRRRHLWRFPGHGRRTGRGLLTGWHRALHLISKTKQHSERTEFAWGIKTNFISFSIFLSSPNSGSSPKRRQWESKGRQSPPPSVHTALTAPWAAQGSSADARPARGATAGGGAAPPAPDTTHRGLPVL